MLITEAHAQTAEAIKAGAQAADTLLQYKVLGAACIFLLIALGILGLVVRHLYNENKGLHKEARTDREGLIKAVEASNDATERFEKALLEIRATLDSRHQTVADLAQRVELIAKDAQHGLRNVSQAIAGVARLIDRRRPSREPEAEDLDWGSR